MCPSVYWIVCGRCMLLTPSNADTAQSPISCLSVLVGNWISSVNLRCMDLDLCMSMLGTSRVQPPALTSIIRGGRNIVEVGFAMVVTVQNIIDIWYIKYHFFFKYIVFRTCWNLDTVRNIHKYWYYNLYPIFPTKLRIPSWCRGVRVSSVSGLILCNLKYVVLRLLIF